MSEAAVAFEPKTTEIRHAGQVVGITDRVYAVEGSRIVFNEVLVKGDLAQVLEYNGAKLRIVRIDTVIGLEIGPHGARGPIWKGVECEKVE